MTTSKNVLIISSDGHVNAQLPEYRAYLEERYLEAFDEYLRRRGDNNDVSTGFQWREGTAPGKRADGTIFADPSVSERYAHEFVEPGLLDAANDPHRRILEVEKEGIAAEVLFPNQPLPFFQHIVDPPDLCDGLPGGFAAAELRLVGARAYNRWLADYCRVYPERFIGQGVIHWDDREAALAEIKRCAEDGLRGIILPGVEAGLPAHWDPVYDDIWSTCEEVGLPVNFHAPAGVPPYPRFDGMHPATFGAVTGVEFAFWSRRPLWFMIFGGVLERHPELKVGFTEQFTDWVAGTLAQMDYSWGPGKLRDDIRDVVPRRPSEYWARQCFCGSSILSAAEAELIPAAGIPTILFGVDFPHQESTFGHTRPWIQATLTAAGLNEAELRMVLGENAARIFNVDTEPLQAVADRIGPSAAELLAPVDSSLMDEFRASRIDVLRPSPYGVLSARAKASGASG